MGKKNYDKAIQTAADAIAEQEQGSSVTISVQVEPEDLPAVLRAMKRRLTPRQEMEIYTRSLTGEKHAAVANEFGMKRSQVAQLVRRLKDEESE